MYTLLSFAQLNVSEKESIMVKTQSLHRTCSNLKMAYSLRDYENKNRGLNHLHMPVPASKDYCKCNTINKTYAGLQSDEWLYKGREVARYMKIHEFSSYSGMQESWWVKSFWIKHCCHTSFSKMTLPDRKSCPKR